MKHFLVILKLNQQLMEASGATELGVLNVPAVLAAGATLPCGHPPLCAVVALAGSPGGKAKAGNEHYRKPPQGLIHT